MTCPYMDTILSTYGQQGQVVHMAVNNHRAPSRPIPLGRDDAAKMRAEVRAHAATSPEAARKLLALIDALEASSSAWRFGMVGLVEDEAVAYWIADNAIRKGLSVKLWASLKRRMRGDTQEVLMDREEMMRLTGASSSHISAALGELASINAIERRGSGRSARWFVCASVATHLTGGARDQAQQAAPPLLAPIQGGAS